MASVHSKMQRSCSNFLRLGLRTRTGAGLPGDSVSLPNAAIPLAWHVQPLLFPLPGEFNSFCSLPGLEKEEDGVEGGGEESGVVA